MWLAGYGAAPAAVSARSLETPTMPNPDVLRVVMCGLVVLALVAWMIVQDARE